MSQTAILDEFSSIVQDVYGTYLDAINGFHQNKIFLENNQKVEKKRTGNTIEHQDSLGYGYISDPDEKGVVPVIHNSTQGECKIRNSLDGSNSVVIGNLSICQVYDYWEDYYRQEIAACLGGLKDDLKSDIFGDLRLYRRSIIHHRSIALADMVKCKTINWFKEGDKIKLSLKQVENIMRLVKEEIDRLRAL